MDLANLTQPWALEPTNAKGAMVGFKNSPSTEPISESCKDVLVVVVLHTVSDISVSSKNIQ